MARTSDLKEGKSGKKKAPKPPPKPSRVPSRVSRGDRRSLISRDGSAVPLKKRPIDTHVDDYPRYRAKARSFSVRSAHEDSCYHCLRNAVHCYNIVILLLGLGVLGVGIWLLVTEYSAREVSVLVGSRLFEIGTYLMIGGGGTITLLAFCGCCGTMREDKCVLAFYGVTMTLVLFALCGGSALAFLFRSDLTGAVKEHLTNTIKENYGVDLRKNSKNRLITDAWDSMQRSLQCCGAHGDENGTFSWAAYKLHSGWYNQQSDRVPLVPDSCCKEDKSICTGAERINGPPTNGPPMEKGYVRNAHLYTDGCYNKLVNHLQRNALILGGVAACVPMLLIIGIVIVFCLCARVVKNDDDDDDEADL